ncbi:hypothetical protein M892_00415 [Vibrio campbellii ATCC BAA-1116]|nr:hypothetical protein M892_00415 [Vibrio campbellii ATCC BAA-1116]
MQGLLTMYEIMKRPTRHRKEGDAMLAFNRSGYSMMKLGKLT